MSDQPIAVFDSGLGGLSVVRRLRELLPAERIVYFGDTARVPYGIKSRPTVAHFALQTARFLLQYDPKLIVAACNTASAVALDAIQEGLPVPVLGVVEPGALAAVEHAGDGPVAVIGTEATIGSGAYERAIAARRRDLSVLSRACPLFVPLVEEGRTCADAVVKLTVDEYLRDLHAAGVTTVVLGCTHYPLLAEAIAEFLGPEVFIVDSGLETSRAVQATLAERGLLRAARDSGSMRCFVSDNPLRFREIGSRFLNEPLDDVEFVEAERYVGLSAPTR